MSTLPKEPIKSEPDTAPAQPHRTRLWIIGGVALVLLAIGASIAFGFYRHYTSSEGSPTAKDLKRFARSLIGVNAARVEQIARAQTWDKMTPRLRVTLFVAILFGTLLWAGAILFYEYILKLIWPEIRRNRFAPYLWMRRSVLSAAGVGVVCIVYGFYIEPYWLEVTHIQVDSSKLPKGGRVRIAHISDLHMGRTERLEPRLPEVIQEQHPDLIVFSGDAMNSSTVLPRFQDFMRDIGIVAPVYVVKGNQDGGAWEAKNVYNGTFVHQMTGQVESLNVRGVDLWIRGLPDEVNYTDAPLTPPRDRFSIFIYHRPDAIMEAAEDLYDLYLCGHTHGGQVALPFYGALITFSKFGKRFEAGEYEVLKTTMYVNRGIGLAKWPQPEARFFARPELTVIDIVGR